jgi:hypothetical protein
LPFPRMLHFAALFLHERTHTPPARFLLFG